MKKFTRTVALLLMGGSTLLTSCVSEDISPEVENLRQAQVTYLNAKAAMEQAKAENQAALTAKIQAETALIQLQAELQQAILQAQTDSMIAEYEAAVAKAQAEVAAAQQRAAEAQLALQQAIDNLAAQVNETAREYLVLYQNTMSQANSKLEEIVQAEGQLARFSAYIDINGNVIDFDQAAAELTAQIAADEVQIAALEAAIDRLEGLNTDAASVEAELEEIYIQLDELEAARASAYLDYQLASDEFTPLMNNYYDARNLFYNNIPNKEMTVAALEEDYAEQEEVVNTFLDQMAPFEAELTAVTDNFSPALEEFRSLLADWIQAKAEFDAKAINNGPGDEAYDNAEQALNEAKTAYEDFAGITYYSTYFNPQYILDYSENTGTLLNFVEASSEFGQIVNEYTNVLNDASFQNLQYRLNNELNVLGNIDWDLYYATYELGSLQDNLNWILEKYEVADFSELDTMYLQEMQSYNAVYRNYYELSSEYNALSGTAGTLQMYLNGTPRAIENRIANLQAEVQNLENNIEASKTALVNNEISAEEWAATIVRTQEKIDRLTVEYNALVALANNFLEQFNAVVED